MTLPTIEEVKTALSDKEHGIRKFREMLRNLTRVELLDFEDIYNEEDIDFVWSIFYEVMYEHEWPLKRDTFNEFANNDSIRIDKLDKQVDGMQKKLDKIVQLLEGFQITMSVKDALKL